MDGCGLCMIVYLWLNHWVLLVDNECQFVVLSTFTFLPHWVKLAAMYALENMQQQYATKLYSCSFYLTAWGNSIADSTFAKPAILILFIVCTCLARQQLTINTEVFTRPAMYVTMVFTQSPAVLCEILSSV